MSGWAKTHAIRIAAARREIDEAIVRINERMQHMPSHFVIGVNADGRVISMIDKNNHPENEKKETETDGLQ